MKFELESEYIEMIKLLKLLGIAESGAEAKQIVESGDVAYNGSVDYRKRLKVRKNDQVSVHGVVINIV